MIAREKKTNGIWDRYFAMNEFHEEEKEIEIPKKKEMFFFLSEGRESAWRKIIHSKCRMSHHAFSRSNQR